MTAWPEQPVIYEVNTAVWLSDLGRSNGAGMTLGDVPGEAWDRLLPPGIDAVWLMGVWTRSAIGTLVAVADAQLEGSFRQALPDVRRDDVIGSPYCVRRYEVDPMFGGREGLAKARGELARRGLRLLVDYVPNHVAPDHPWTMQHPEYFIAGTNDDLQRDPNAFVDIGGDVLALGRDPYFPPWPDVVQLNAFSPALRVATADVLADIGSQADGVRCDMAMLMRNEVFARTWGERAGAPPATDFWPEVLERVRETHPDMLFVAEAYWDMEWSLQDEGFDYCYDKRLYDRIVHEDAAAVRAHLGAGADYQRHLVRFLENHDEPRAASTMPPERERAAAVAIATLPGAVLWQAGQFEGRKVRLPVFLSRQPHEAPDRSLQAFHDALLRRTRAAEIRCGDWRLLEATGWPDNDSCRHLLAWCWEGDGGRHVVVINFSDETATGRVRLPWDGLAGASWLLSDILDDSASFTRSGDELAGEGLFVALAPWQYHVLSVAAAPVIAGLAR